MRWVSGLLGLVLVGSVLSAAEPTFTTAQRSWWSLKPVAKPRCRRSENAAWVKTPIDAFVLAGLEAKSTQRRIPPPIGARCCAAPPSTSRASRRPRTRSSSS